MARIPTPPLLLGLAGLIPFLWGGATTVSGTLRGLSDQVLAPSFSGPALLTGYGVVILSFMAGVIWGFVTRDTSRFLTLGLVLSVLPALWAFFMASAPGKPALLALALGFSGLLLIDWICAQRGLAPAWWMSLRALLTGVVLFCLVLGYLFAP